MPKEKPEEEKMSIMDAVDNLSCMAELNVGVDEEGEIPIMKKNLCKLAHLESVEKEETLAKVKTTFKTIHNYLRRVCQDDGGQLEDVEMQRGIKAIMVLADEAADNLKYTSLFKCTYKEGQITEIKEYSDLHFYYNKLVKRFQKMLVSEAKWKEMWSVEDKNIDIERQGLKDLEMVKRDKEYELFYIRKDDGEPFFNRNLLRHIKLVRDFGEMMSSSEGEDPLLPISVMLDKGAQAVAENIRKDVKHELGDFMVEAMHYKDIPLVKNVIKLTMSLMLACNAHNLIEYTMGKMCLRYLQDYHKFLRQILSSEEYKRLINYSIEETDKLSRCLLYLIHACAYAFFTWEGRQAEFQEYYQSLLSHALNGEMPQRRKKQGMLPFFNDIFDQYDLITKMLQKYPNGPLFKTLDIFSKRDEGEGFDPIIQGNLPYQLYKLSIGSLTSKCLKLPCPTLHTHINKAKIINEFKAFLRHIEMKKELGNHLLFNLQDRTAWGGHARCQALEKLETEAEFNGQIVIVTLPKKTDFYYQTDIYLGEDSAETFIKLLIDQISSREECGFYFSRKISGKRLDAFVKKIIPLIHIYFFSEKKVLDRKERLDFIEIFYMFLYLKIFDMIRPGSFSFTCKDGVDIGATTHAGFIALIKLISGNMNWSEREQHHLLWVLNAAALSVRERMVNTQCLNRVLSALGVLSECFSKGREKIMGELEPLYENSLLQQVGYTLAAPVKKCNTPEKKK